MDNIILEKEPSFRGPAAGYRVVLEVHGLSVDENGNESVNYIEFDGCDSVTDSEQSSVSSYPMITGKEAADHIVHKPANISISGTYATISAKNKYFKSEGVDRLSFIQTVFKKIRLEGLQCSLYWVRNSDSAASTNKSTIFNVKENLLLETVTWTEKVSYMDFQMSFKQVMIADALTIDDIDIEVDSSMAGYPSLVQPQQADFGSTLVNVDDIIDNVIAKLADVKLISLDFMQDYRNYATSDKCSEHLQKFVSKLIVSVVAAVVAVVIKKVVQLIIQAVVKAIVKLLVQLGVDIAAGAAIGASASVFPVGTIVAAVVAIGFGIAAIIEAAKAAEEQAKYKLVAFELKKTLEERNSENERFSEFVASLTTRLNCLNDVLTCYNLPADKDCYMTLEAGDQYLAFEFTKLNTENADDKELQGYNLKVLDLSKSNNETPVYDEAFVPIKGINFCTNQNCLFQTADGRRVYLVKPDIERLERTEGVTAEEIEKATKSLDNTILLISSIDMSKYTQLINETIAVALKENLTDYASQVENVVNRYVTKSSLKLSL